MLTSRVSITAAAVALPVLLSQAALAAPITFSASGANPAVIQGQVGAFQAALGGGGVAGANGSFGGLRREINWDGVPNAFSAPNNLPANFFNVNSPRGVVFSTPGNGFQVSSTAASGTPFEFGNINASYTNQFQTFSAERLFTALGSNVLDVNFFVPGTTTAALTRGFGSVFTDVDLATVTSLAFFDASNTLLDTLFVQPGLVLPGQTPSESLSFLGADYGSAIVSRVRITSGNTALGPTDGGSVDIVVMDDFLYGEPVAASVVPEPGTLTLLAAGMIGLGLAGSRRRRA